MKGEYSSQNDKAAHEAEVKFLRCRKPLNTITSRESGAVVTVVDTTSMLPAPHRSNLYIININSWVSCMLLTSLCPVTVRETIRNIKEMVDSI
jgi:hypothetical protein